MDAATAPAAAGGLVVMTPQNIFQMALQVVRAAGLSSSTFSENHYSEYINPGNNQGLTLFNAATPFINSDKQITKNTQKIMDLLEDLKTRHQWVKIIHQIPNKASTDNPTDQEF
eukprot:261138-Ditylum_brightwellii.AAC.1